MSAIGRIKEGDRGWRGYARQYHSDFETWFPEIRPCYVRRINPDGTLELTTHGVIPGREGKRAPHGIWTHLKASPSLFCRTPEAALKQAKKAVEQALVDHVSKGEKGEGG